MGFLLYFNLLHALTSQIRKWIALLLNYIETNPWSLTNSNALATVLMESIFTKNFLYLIPAFLKLLAYRFSTHPQHQFILTLIFYSLSTSLILLILLWSFLFFLTLSSIICHKYGLSA